MKAKLVALAVSFAVALLMQREIPNFSSLARAILTLVVVTYQEDGSWVLFGMLAGCGWNLMTTDVVVIGIVILLRPAESKSDISEAVGLALWKVMVVLSSHQMRTGVIDAKTGILAGVCIVSVYIWLMKQVFVTHEARLLLNNEEISALKQEIESLKSHFFVSNPDDLQMTRSKSTGTPELILKLKHLTPTRDKLMRSRTHMPTAAGPPIPKRQGSLKEIEETGSLTESEMSMDRGEADPVTFPSNESSIQTTSDASDLSTDEINGLITNIMSQEYVLWQQKKRGKSGHLEPNFVKQLMQFTSVVPGGSKKMFNPLAKAQIPLNTLMEENEELAEVMSKLGEWDFNTLDLVRCTKEPLKEVSYYLFSTHSIPEKFSMSRSALIKFLRETECRYRKENFYHNSLHAADVLNSVIFLLSSGLHRCGHFLDLEVFGLMVAAIGHDVNHPGVNNVFLINNSDPLALKFNDKSVLENMHAATVFSILRKPECNILYGLGMADFMCFRKVVIALILATDLQRHFTLQAEYRRDLEELGKTLEEEEFRLRTLEICIKCADLGHGAKETSIHVRWTELITQEFFNQGDKEQALGLPLSPLCDRTSVLIPKSQLGFLTVMVKPLFDLWEELVKLSGEWEEEGTEFPFSICCRRISENLLFWETESTRLEARGEDYRLFDTDPPMLIVGAVQA